MNAIRARTAASGNGESSGPRPSGHFGSKLLEGAVVCKQATKFAGSVTAVSTGVQDVGVPVAVNAKMHGTSDDETVHAIEIVPCAPLGERRFSGNTPVSPCVTVCVIELDGGGSTQNAPVAVPPSAIVCGLPGALSTSVSAAALAGGTFTQSGANVT